MSNQYSNKQNYLPNKKLALAQDFLPYPHNPDYLVNKTGSISSIYLWPILKKQATDPKGYKKTMIREQGKQKFALVHRLVAITFMGDMTDDGKEIDHKDGDKNNNRIENLEWVTPRENEMRKRNRLGKLGYGEYNSNAKLSDWEVAKIKLLWTGGKFSQYQIAKRFGISQSQVHNLVSGKTRIKGTI